MARATLRGRFARRQGLGIVTVLRIGMLAAPAFAQVGFDRPGADYASAAVRSGDPTLCAARCEHDPRCGAWSFSYPQTLDSNATCRLKSAVTRSVAAPCCVAGIRGASVVLPHVPGMEFSIERPGGDYRSLDPAPSPGACATSCQADAHCRAWTYLRPGYRGPDSHCFLKSQVTRPRVQACCVSGVVR